MPRSTTRPCLSCPCVLDVDMRRGSGPAPGEVLIPIVDSLCNSVADSRPSPSGSSMAHFGHDGNPPRHGSLSDGALETRNTQQRGTRCRNTHRRNPRLGHTSAGSGLAIGSGSSTRVAFRRTTVSAEVGVYMCAGRASVRAESPRPARPTRTLHHEASSSH